MAKTRPKAVQPPDEHDDEDLVEDLIVSLEEAAKQNELNRVRRAVEGGG